MYGTFFMVFLQINIIIGILVDTGLCAYQLQKRQLEKLFLLHTLYAQVYVHELIPELSAVHSKRTFGCGKI